MGTATFDFTGESVLVTGTGRGFGRVLSLACAASGAKVAKCDIDATSGEETLDVLLDAGGDGFFTEADVSRVEQAAAFVDEAAARHGGLDAAINNACGEVAGPRSEAHALDFDQFMGLIPIKRCGSAAEIDWATVFLCSEASGFIVAEVLVRDGGWTIPAPSSFG